MADAERSGVSGCEGAVGELDSGVVGVDAGGVIDAGTTDAGGGVIDSGIDAGVDDAGFDAGLIEVDAGTDAGVDAGVELDAGTMDSGVVVPRYDAGAACVPIDAGPFDAGGDFTPPTLISFTLSPQTVDTSAGPAIVTVSAVITDDISGVSLVTDALLQPNGTTTSLLSRSAGTALNGTYSRTLVLPQHTPMGRVRFTGLVARDVVGNQLTVSFDDAGVDQLGVGDVSLPELVSFSVSPSSIDTSASSRDVLVTARVTDDLSGAIPALVWTWPNGATGSFGVPMTRTMGTAIDGTYTSNVTVPRNMAPGDVTFVLFVNDAAGRARTYTLADAGFPDRVAQIGAGDSTPPRLTSLTVTPSSVDVRNASANVVIRLVEAPDLVMIDRTNGFGTFMRLPDCSSRFPPFLPQADGSWTATVQVPQGTRAGRVNLTLDLVDLVGNRVRLTGADLFDAGWPSGFDVQ